MRTPDFDQLLKVLRREAPDRPTLFEFFLNGPLEELLAGDGAQTLKAQPHGWLRLRMKAFEQAGYDYVTIPGSDFGFPAGDHAHKKTISLNDGFVIHDEESFAAYRWPDPAQADYSQIEALAPFLPEGMKFIVCGPCGVLENTIRLVGYENLCFMVADEPELTQRIFDHVGERLLTHYQTALQHDAVGAIIVNDDWGFKTQPMLAPDDMRRYVFPWHKRIVAAAHERRKPAILHSCGNYDSIIDDVIDDMRFDGRHSYEDAIEPVEAAYERLQGRIAVMGGIDLDFICRSTPEEVHHRSQAMLEKAFERGGYALGTGNSVPEYVPVQNYLAMISAATGKPYDWAAHAAAS